MNSSQPDSVCTSDKRTFYHYTNMQAFLGIVNSNHITMWATHYNYLNDKEEIKRGIDLIRDYYNRKNKKSPN